AQQKLELEHLRNEEQSRLLDMLNHEIKTPMSVIRLALGFDKRSAAVMQHANRAMMDMDAIVDRCLQINRLDQHRLEPALQPLRVRRLADEVREASQAPERIVLEGAPRIVLSSDPLLLRIVLGNLIDNALKYGRVDQPVRVGMTRQRHAGRDGVQVQVSNLPGTAGMPDGARVFEKYYRSPGAHGSSGSGLGLYLVRSVMELLGGWVRYSPTAGEVRFELWIPR
ncbi:MAG: HAMP domain-containing sensor histidine kinase, partial [Betaproteobacteria bacterium]|nr:HAMP domain-containing sensor histidine kinase [Betaproteobacteria bacterium]